ncbi:hypothetical protein GCM10020220_099570 [Nonomuraea rubra]|uniref:alpha/beta fold hydrolase n=1 Tax=Nonomuraea rubra TaxID=46180 RepID=UPI0031F05820
MIITAKAADGTEARAVDEGGGPAVLVLHPGLDDGTSWKAVAARLAPHHRVVRLHRRRYRLDLDQRAPCTVAQEVEHVLAMAEAIGGGPVLLAGHSSGAVIALEAMVAAPSALRGRGALRAPGRHRPAPGRSGRRGPPPRPRRHRRGPPRPGHAHLRPRHGGAARLGGAAGGLVRGRDAPDARPGSAPDRGQRRHGTRSGSAWTRTRASGRRWCCWGGDRSPAHLGERLDALERTLPHPRRVLLPGQGHSAHAKAPDRVAAVIASLAAEVYGES